MVHLGQVHDGRARNDLHQPQRQHDVRRPAVRLLADAEVPRRLGHTVARVPPRPDAGVHLVLVRRPDDGAKGPLRQISLGRAGRHHPHRVDQGPPSFPHRHPRDDQQGFVP